MSKGVRKDLLRTLFSRMLATYLTVTLGMLLVTGVTVGALVQGISLRDAKATILRELPALSDLFRNSGSSIVSQDAVHTELTLIARHYDAYFEWIPHEGEIMRYSSGLKWSRYASADYNEIVRAEIIASAANTEGGEALFRQRNDDFPVLIATQVFSVEGNVLGVIRFYTDITSIKTTMDMVYLEVMLVCLIAVLISVIAVYYTTSRMTKPFMEINEIVQRYSKGDFSARIPISSTEEATQLAVSFNVMADQLKDLEATRRSFVANVSHELRSPLTSMKGFLEAMQDGTIGPEEYEKYIGIVLSETRRMATMVNDLLDLARIESGKTALRLEVFDINELIRRTLLTFEARIYEKHMEAEVKFAQDVSHVEADNAQISQVLRNLIDNAIKYSQGSTKIRIATYAMRREVYVSIQDFGQGIPEEDIPHVFDRFYKVEKAHTPTKQSGTGLGLSIVKRIIDQHGQTITLKSAKGKGSTFTFTLKRVSPPKRQQDGGKRNG